MVNHYDNLTLTNPLHISMIFWAHDVIPQLSQILTWVKGVNSKKVVASGANFSKSATSLSFLIEISGKLSITNSQTNLLFLFLDLEVVVVAVTDWR